MSNKTPRELAEEISRSFWPILPGEFERLRNLTWQEFDAEVKQRDKDAVLRGIEAGAKMGWVEARIDSLGSTFLSKKAASAEADDWWAELNMEGVKSPKASGDICAHCKAEVNNRCDDNYNASHSEWCCPYCNKWQEVKI